MNTENRNHITRKRTTTKMNGTSCCFESLVRILPLKDFNTDYMRNHYAVILKSDSCTAKAGCRCCDYQDGTVSFYSPTPNSCPHSCNKTIIPQHDESSKGKVLTFSCELLECSEGAWKPEDFTFFGYNYNESLHVSSREKEILEDAISDIKRETDWGVDKYSCRLILRKIELLLIYCKRFYDRQFQIRSEACRCIISKINDAIDEHITTRHNAEASESAIAEIANRVKLSPAYLADYILFSNGQNMQEYIQMRQMEQAKQLLCHTSFSAATVSRQLGFSSPNRFTAMIKKVYGMSPAELRNRS